MNTKNLREILKNAPLKRPAVELDVRVEALFAAVPEPSSCRYWLIRILSIAAGIVIVTILLFIMHGEPKTEHNEMNGSCNVSNDQMCRTVYVHAENLDHLFEQEISSVRFVETKI